jgi:hypothetical protein
MRMLTIRHDTDLQGLSGLLLDARLSSARSDAALDALQAANPHVDLKNLRAGTVLFVPEEPGLKASASVSVPGAAFSDFQQMIRSALSQAAENMKSANAARDHDLAAVTAAIKSAAVRRIIDSDRELAKQVADDTKALEQDQEQAKQAEQTLAQASRAALATLAEVGKRFS